MDMPKECAKCNLYDHEYDVCEPTDKNVRTFGKPDWCPLRELMEKKEADIYTTAYDKATIIGYNACIDELLGEEHGK